MPNLARWIAYIVSGLFIVTLCLVIAAVFLLNQFDLSDIAAPRASVALGHDVTIGGLHITPGRWINVDLQDVHVANSPGGSKPEMAVLKHMTAEVEALSLLHNSANIRNIHVDGLSVLLERTANDAPNWRKKRDEETPQAQQDRTNFPTLNDVAVRSSEITFRTSSGKNLVSRIDEGHLHTDSIDTPVQLKLTGSYHEVPVVLTALLQSITAFRNSAEPYGTDLQFQSGDMSLHFAGTMTKPLDVDGADGTLTLHAPSIEPIMGMAGSPGTIKAELDLSGKLKHADTLWELADATGKLDNNVLTPSLLRFVDGGHGHPDDVTISVGFDTLNLDQLLAANRGGGHSGGSTSPLVEREPDPRLHARLAARAISYDHNDASNLKIAADVIPNEIKVSDLTLTVFGARVIATGRAEVAGKGSRVTAEGSVTGLDVQQLRRLLGARSVPMTGRLDGLIALNATGETAEAAEASANMSSVIWMTSGSVSRDIIEKASLDVRRLFRSPNGMSPVLCMLGIVDLHGKAGTVSPFRIRTADGTIAGRGSFDLARNQIDVTVGSEASTTSDFALDVPVRISGSLSNPSIRPASTTPAMATPDLSKLPPRLRQAAQKNACATR